MPTVQHGVKSSPVQLPDGSVVVIRTVQPEDAPLLADGFAQLSLESRQLRFLTGKPHLTPAELRYLTEIDHHSHEALLALNTADGRAVGVARYIRDTEAPQDPTEPRLPSPSSTNGSAKDSAPSWGTGSLIAPAMKESDASPPW